MLNKEVAQKGREKKIKKQKKQHYKFVLNHPAREDYLYKEGTSWVLIAPHLDKHFQQRVKKKEASVHGQFQEFAGGIRRYTYMVHKLFSSFFFIKAILEKEKSNLGRINVFNHLSYIFMYSCMCVCFIYYTYT